MFRRQLHLSNGLARWNDSDDPAYDEARAAPSILPSDRADLEATLQLEALAEKAWENDGKDALDHFDRLCLEPHDGLVIYKAVVCLWAYRCWLEKQSVEDAKAALAKDNAANRVEQWYETDGINQQIAANHPEQRYAMLFFSPSEVQLLTKPTEISSNSYAIFSLAVIACPKLSLGYGQLT